MKLVVVVAACLVIASDLSAQGAQLPIVGTWRTGPLAGGGYRVMTLTQSGDTLTVQRAVVDSAGKPVSTTTDLYIRGTEWTAPDNSIRTSMTTGLGGRFVELSTTVVAPETAGSVLVTRETLSIDRGQLVRRASDVSKEGRVSARAETWTSVPKP